MNIKYVYSSSSENIRETHDSGIQDQGLANDINPMRNRYMLNLPLKSAANHVLSQKLSHVPPEKPSPVPREERIEITPKRIIKRIAKPLSAIELNPTILALSPSF